MVALRYHLCMPPVTAASEGTVARPPSLARYASYLSAQVSKAASRILTEGLARHELRLPHFAVLAALEDLGPQCQQDLCDALDHDKSHMVGFVDDLEERGLLVRERDTEDRRRWRVGITEDGRALLGDLHAVEARCQEELFGVLTDDQREVLVGLLQGVVAQADHLRLGGTADGEGA